MSSTMRCPHDIFRHMLSFKDPHYEHVRSGGDPFGKTPTRVWYTWREYCGADGVKRTPAISRCSNPVVITTYSRYFAWWHDDTQLQFEVAQGIRLLELRMNPDMFDEGADYKCPRKLAEVSLQCDACGPDLFVGAQSISATK